METSNVVEYLGFVVGSLNKLDKGKKYDRLFRCNEHFILHHGRHFIPTDRTFTALSEFRGDKKACFTNTQRYLFNDLWNGAGDYLYAEGYAVPERVPLPTYHAWLVNRHTLAAVDLTWDSGVEYFGVVFPTRFVVEYVSETKLYQPIIDNWQDEWPFLSGKFKYSWSPDSLGLDSVRILKKIAELKEVK